MTEIKDVITLEKREVNPEKEIGLAWINHRGNDKSEMKFNSQDQRPPRVQPVISKESLIPLLVQMVDSSSDIICVSSFLLQGSELTNSLLKASDRGVRVYILTAGEEDLKVTDEDGSPSAQRVKEFRQLLSNISDKVFLRTADFHAKFVLVDPDSIHPMGVMTTCNLTIDAMSGTNKELYVTLSNEEVYSFYCQFTMGLWKMSRHELRGGKLQELEENRFLPDTPIPDPIHPATLHTYNSLYESVRKLLITAMKSVDISAWTFTDEVDIPNLLMECLNRGVAVKIYTRPNYMNGIVLSKLKAKGAQVLAHDRFHAKMILVDGERSIVTTANFAKHGLQDGFEAGVILNKNDTKQLSRILSNWEKECNWELSDGTEIEALSGTIKMIDSKAEEVKEVIIKDEKVINVPDLKPKEIKREEELILKPPPQEPGNGVIYKRFIYKYKVFQPHIPKGAKKVEGLKEKFGIFKLESTMELFIPIYKWEELDGAREVAIRHNAKVMKSAME